MRPENAGDPSITKERSNLSLPSPTTRHSSVGLNLVTLKRAMEPLDGTAGKRGAPDELVVPPSQPPRPERTPAMAHVVNPLRQLGTAAPAFVFRRLTDDLGDGR